MNDYTYPNMTQDLQTYLDLRGMHPGYKYSEGSQGVPTPKSKAAVDAWTTEVATAKARLPEGEPRAYYKAIKEWMCRDETKVESPANKEHISPSGRYRLVVTAHGTGPGTWSYAKGRVYRGDTLIETVCRNYSSFPFLFVEDHPNGHDYLMAGEDYQGQTVIELDTGRRVDTLPEAASQGFGFCWADYSASPSKLTLAVSGCYWAAPYEVWFVDFTNPMDHPLPVLHRDRDAEDFFDWTGPDACSIGRSFDVYIPLDKREDDLTDDEWEDVSRRESEGTERKDLWKMGRETITWTRPSDLEIAQKAVKYIAEGWANGDRPIPKDLLDNVLKLIARVPETDQVCLRTMMGMPS